MFMALVNVKLHSALTGSSEVNDHSIKYNPPANAYAGSLRPLSDERCAVCSPFATRNTHPIGDKSPGQPSQTNLESFLRA
jgi:hypothetical protein